jgi:MoaA/NifB/PqqE/SkfB family radical SAM enzyme
MRALNWLTSVIRNRYAGVPRPSWCTYLVTYRCNARCKMCGSWRFKPGEEMTPADAGAVFRKIGRLDVVRLTGGEPFLRTDLLEVAEVVQAASRPHVLHVSTNGSFPERVFDFVTRFSAPRRLRLMVSFDGRARRQPRPGGLVCEGRRNRPWTFRATERVRYRG